MGEVTKIQWCDHTFNPWWGCVKVSAGCEHCYAEGFAKRTGCDVFGPDKPRRFFGDKHWAEPLKWNAKAEAAGVRRRVFCGSMCDVFEWIDSPTNELILPRERLWALIEATPWLDWQLLTKRPANMTRLSPAAWADGWPRNAWALATVENQEVAASRIVELLGVPAAVRGLSLEPLLGPVDLSPWLFCEQCDNDAWPGRGAIRDDLSSAAGGKPWHECGCAKLGWVIVGGESGHGARPMHPDWARSIRDQCQEAGVPFFFKQWGEWAEATRENTPATNMPFGPREHAGLGRIDESAWQGQFAIWGEYRNEWGWHYDGHPNARPDWHHQVMSHVGKKAAGRLLDGREWNEIPTQEGM